MITRLPVLLIFVASSLAFSPMPSSLQPMTPKTEHFHSPSVLAMSVETTAMLTAIDSFYQTQPYQAAFLTCSLKASAADWVVQVSRQKMIFRGMPPFYSTEESIKESFNNFCTILSFQFGLVQM
jgi:hypothetical protein